MNWPRAVAIMPTKNRPQMAHRAIHYFFDQNYDGDKHLLVVNDGVVPVETCYGCKGRFELVDVPAMKLPTKRNMMMELVGDKEAIYFLWDDDDYHGPGRMRRQALVAQEYQACLLRPTLYYNSITKDLRVSSWISDGTAAYTWDFWSRRRFDDRVDPGSGRKFVTFPKPIEELNGAFDYAVVVHRGQRHTPPAFGYPAFHDAPVDASWLQQRLRLR